MQLTDYDVKILKELNGEPQEDVVWGAAMAVCLEDLARVGYITRGPDYTITQKGKDFLNETRPTV